MAGQPTIFKLPRKIIIDSTVAASGTTNPTMTVPPDCDFEWDWLSIFRTSGLLKALMNETGAAQRPFILNGSPQISGLFSGIYVDNWAGLVASNGAFPEMVPYVMPANRNYQFQFTDLSAAQNVVQLAFHGYGLLPVQGGSSSS